jgi:serine/threonine protein phosphatase PrpC
VFHVLGGTVTGPQHISDRKGREDSYSFAQEGMWTIAVVCDGCGSAQYAREGADFISSYLSRQLVAIASDIAGRGPGGWIVDAIVSIFAEMRETMRSQFGEPINAYAATVVGAMLSPNGGFIVHLGDGIASGFSLSDTGNGVIPILKCQSNPENGKSSNETFYATGPNWIKHLRIEPIPKGIDCLLLCTDGAQSLLYKDNTPSHNITLLLKNIYAAAAENAKEVIENFLESSAAKKVSGDDKTLLLLISSAAWRGLAGLREGLRPQEVMETSRSHTPSPQIIVAPMVESISAGKTRSNQWLGRQRLQLFAAFAICLVGGIYLIKWLHAGRNDAAIAPSGHEGTIVRQIQPRKELLDGHCILQTDPRIRSRLGLIEHCSVLYRRR